MVKTQLAFVLLVFLTGCSMQGAIVAQPNDVIVIGFVGPLTGDAATYGQIEKNVIEIALDEMNHSIAGKPVRIVYEDGKCSSKDAATAGQKLIEIDKVKVIFSVCSAETLAIAPLAEENKVLLLTAWASNPAISDSGDYIFSTSYSDDDTGKAMAEAMQKYEKVGVIYEETGYPTGIKNSFVRHFAGIAYVEGFVQNSHDVRTQITKLLAQKPEAFLVNPDTPATGISILQQLRQLEFTGQLYGNVVLGSDAVVMLQEADGMVFFADPVIKNNQLKAHLLEEYSVRFGKYPDFEYPAVSRYDDMYLLKQAIESVGYDADKIKNYLYGLDSFTGGLGTYHFDENGDMIGIKPSVKQIKDGKIVRFEN